jgi:hypothetical protein
VQFLEGVAEGRTVDLGQDVRSNLNAVVGSDAHEIMIEGGMVDLAHRDPIGHQRIAALGIAQNVGSVQELGMA